MTQNWINIKGPTKLFKDALLTWTKSSFIPTATFPYLLVYNICVFSLVFSQRCFLSKTTCMSQCTNQIYNILNKHSAILLLWFVSYSDKYGILLKLNDYSQPILPCSKILVIWLQWICCRNILKEDVFYVYPFSARII